MLNRQKWLENITVIETNIREALEDPNSNADMTLRLLDQFDEAVAQTKNHADELRWDMLNAQAFITSVQTSTGKII